MISLSKQSYATGASVVPSLRPLFQEGQCGCDEPGSIGRPLDRLSNSILRTAPAASLPRPHHAGQALGQFPETARQLGTKPFRQVRYHDLNLPSGVPRDDSDVRELDLNSRRITMAAYDLTLLFGFPGVPGTG